MSLHVSSAKGDIVDFDFKNENHISNGITYKNGIDIAIKSNQNWRLNISSTSANFSYFNGDISTLPVRILSFQSAKKVNPIVLSMVEQEIASGPKGGNSKKENNFSLDVIATPGLDAQSGSFITNVIFTLTPD